MCFYGMNRLSGGTQWHDLCRGFVALFLVYFQFNSFFTTQYYISFLLALCIVGNFSGNYSMVLFFSSGWIQISHANTHHLPHLSFPRFCTECTHWKAVQESQSRHTAVASWKLHLELPVNLWSHWLRAQLHGESPSAIPECWHGSVACHSKARHLGSRWGLPTLHCTSELCPTRDSVDPNPSMTSANTAPFFSDLCFQITHFFFPSLTPRIST